MNTEDIFELSMCDNLAHFHNVGYIQQNFKKTTIPIQCQGKTSKIK